MDDLGELGGVEAGAAYENAADAGLFHEGGDVFGVDAAAVEDGDFAGGLRVVEVGEFGGGLRRR